MQDGIKSELAGDLTDKSYDGLIEAKYLSGGLGLLVDGHQGADEDFLTVQQHWNTNHWVGWNRLQHSDGLQIKFTFNAVRVFHSVDFVCTAFFSNETQVFSKIDLNFSVDGKYFQNNALIIPAREQSGALVKLISVPLENRRGQFVSAKLHFASNWTGLSEIKFISTAEQIIPGPHDKNLHHTPESSVDFGLQPSATSENPLSEAKDLLEGNLYWIIIPVAVVLSLVVIFIIWCAHQKIRTDEPSNRVSSAGNEYLRQAQEMNSHRHALSSRHPIGTSNYVSWRRTEIRQGTPTPHEHSVVQLPLMRQET